MRCFHILYKKELRDTVLGGEGWGGILTMTIFLKKGKMPRKLQQNHNRNTDHNKRKKASHTLPIPNSLISAFSAFQLNPHHNHLRQILSEKKLCSLFLKGKAEYSRPLHWLQEAQWQDLAIEKRDTDFKHPKGREELVAGEWAKQEWWGKLFTVNIGIRRMVRYEENNQIWRTGRNCHVIVFLLNWTLHGQKLKYKLSCYELQISESLAPVC